MEKVGELTRTKEVNIIYTYIYIYIYIIVEGEELLEKINK